jgi:hypothetical protein
MVNTLIIELLIDSSMREDISIVEEKKQLRQLMKMERLKLSEPGI